MRLCTLFLLLMAVAAVANADPILWGPYGAPMSLAGRIEWNRGSSRNADDYTLTVWSDTHIGSREVYAELMDPDGQQLWNFPVQLTSNPNEQSSAAVTATDGGWIIAWIDYRNIPHGDPNYGDYGGELYVQKLDAQGQSLWTAGGVPVTGATYILHNSLELFPDAGGADLVLVTRPGSTSHIAYGHVSAAGQTHFSGNSLDAEGADAFAGATDGSGGVIVTWAEGSRGRICRVTPDGSLPWGTLFACDTLASNICPAIAPDGHGGCFLAWEQTNGASGLDIWAQRFDSSGQRQWTAAGIPACNAGGDQINVALSASLNGGDPDGCLVIWSDGRDNYYGSFYAQKLNSQGTALWMQEGVHLSTYAASEQTVSPISDGQGGMITSWETYRNDFYGRTLSALRLNAAGQMAWPADSVQICPVASEDEGSGILIPLSTQFLTLFQRGPYYGQEICRISAQKMDYATGTRLFGEGGHDLVSLPPGTGSTGSAAPMSGQRTGVAWTAGVTTYYQILNSQGQPTLRADTSTIVPDTTGVNPYFYWASVSQLLSDGGGGCFALLAAGDDEDGYAAFLAHIAPDGHLLGNGKARSVWNDAEVDIASPQAGILASADSSGGCYVAFNSYDPTEGFFLMRFNSACEPLWSAPVRLDTTDYYYTWNEPRLVTDVDGGCLAAWTDYGNHYHLSRISPSGDIAWTTMVNDSVPGEAWDTIHPKLASDGQGGAYCTWMTFENVPDIYHVHAQHVSATGVELWPYNGYDVTTRSCEQSQSRPLLDHEGNLIVLWRQGQSNEDPDNGIYAQKFSPDGSILWSDTGRIVGSGADFEFNPAIGLDDSGGVYAAWLEENDAGTICGAWATHLNSDGFSGPDPYWVQDVGGPICDSTVTSGCQPIILPCGTGSAVVLYLRDVRQSEPSGQSEFYAQRIVPTSLGAKDKSSVLPLRYALYQNYPNPFNPNTLITFDLPQAGMTKLTVFNILGREVTTLVNQNLPAGSHRVNFDASQLASGMYFYRLHSGSFTSTRKMIVLK